MPRWRNCSPYCLTRGWVKYPNRLTPLTRALEKPASGYLVAVDSVSESSASLRARICSGAGGVFMLLILILVECWTETPLAGVQIYQT